MLDDRVDAQHDGLQCFRETVCALAAATSCCFEFSGNCCGNLIERCEDLGARSAQLVARERIGECPHVAQRGRDARVWTSHCAGVDCVRELQLGLPKLLGRGSDSREQEHRVEILLLNAANRGSHAVERVVCDEQRRHKDGSHRDQRENETRSKSHSSASKWATSIAIKLAPLAS